MMRLLVCCISMVVLPALAGGPPLHQFSEPFEGKECQITWALTNALPAKVKIFKVVPTTFSRNSISNWLDLAKLTETNKKRPVQTGVFAGKDVLTFGNREETRSLEIVPSQGFVVLVNSDVIAGARVPSEGVPPRKELLSVALDLVRKIGVKESELATNSAGKVEPRSLSEESDIYKDKPSGQVVTNVLARWVWLNRQLDGITVSGGGGISMKFGNHGMPAEVDLTWRAVEPLKEVAVPRPEDFVRLVKDGRTLIRSGEKKSFKALSITNATLYYWENVGSEPQKYIYPFVVLNANTDLEGEASKVDLFMSLTSD